MHGNCAAIKTVPAFAASEPETPGLLADLTEFVRSLQALADSYRPELHYMRGPGPKWHAKHRRENPRWLAQSAERNTLHQICVITSRECTRAAQVLRIRSCDFMDNTKEKDP